MLTLPQQVKLKQLKKKYAHDLAIHRNINANIADDELFIVLNTLELEAQLIEIIENLEAEVGHQNASEITVLCFAKIYRQLVDIYDKKYSNKKFIERIFNKVFEREDND